MPSMRYRRIASRWDIGIVRLCITSRFNVNAGEIRPIALGRCAGAGSCRWLATPVDGSPFPHAKGLRRRSSRELGRGCEGIALIRRGIAELLQIGNRAGVTGNLATLAVAQLREGAIADALATVEGASTLIPKRAKAFPTRSGFAAKYTLSREICNWLKPTSGSRLQWRTAWAQRHGRRARH